MLEVDWEKGATTCSVANASRRINRFLTSSSNAPRPKRICERTEGSMSEGFGANK
jgi:hypothetical protein